MNRFSMLVAALIAFSAPALASDYMQGDMHIMKPWSRPLPAVSTNGAAYMTLMNTGGTVDKLLAVSTPAAKKAEIHNHIMEGGLMKMRPVGAIEIAPGDSTVLQPGGLHVMLMGLTEPLVEGQSFPLTLEFERAGKVEVMIMVMDPGQMTHDMKHDQKKMSGG